MREGKFLGQENEVLLEVELKNEPHLRPAESSKARKPGKVARRFSSRAQPSLLGGSAEA